VAKYKLVEHGVIRLFMGQGDQKGPNHLRYMLRVDKCTTCCVWRNALRVACGEMHYVLRVEKCTTCCVWRNALHVACGEIHYGLRVEKCTACCVWRNALRVACGEMHYVLHVSTCCMHPCEYMLHIHVEVHSCSLGLHTTVEPQYKDHFGTGVCLVYWKSSGH
jgi:hypothetical protein